MKTGYDKVAGQVLTPPGSEEESAPLLHFYIRKAMSFLAYVLQKGSHRKKDIHKLRVNVKHIRAILSLIDRVQPEQPHTGYMREFLRKPFKRAGKVRLAQINRKIAKDAEDRVLDPFVRFLKEKEEGSYRKMQKSFRGFDLEGFAMADQGIRTLIATLPAGFMLSRCRDFIGERQRMIEEANESPLGDEQVHQIRKWLKEIKTAAQLIMVMEPDDETREFLIDVREKEQDIGKWHDRVEFSRQLGLFMEEGKKRDTTAQPILAFRNELGRKNRRLRDHLLADLEQKLSI